MPEVIINLANEDLILIEFLAPFEEVERKRGVILTKFLVSIEEIEKEKKDNCQRCNFNLTVNYY